MPVSESRRSGLELWQEVQALGSRAWEPGNAEAEDRVWEVLGLIWKLEDPGLVEHLVGALGAEPAWERAFAAWALMDYAAGTGRPFAQRTTPALVAHARSEPDPDARSAMVQAVGRSELVEFATDLRSFATDPAPRVRETVAVELPTIFGAQDMDQPSIDLLIEMTRDVDPHVRDWATFDLGQQTDADSAQIRQALIARLDDTDGDGTATSGEAAVGLATRRDPHVLPYLRRWLCDDVDLVGNLTVEAAGLSGDPSLLPLLQNLKDAGWQETHAGPSCLDQALELLSQLERKQPP